LAKKQLIQKVDHFIEEIVKLKNLNHSDTKFKDFSIRVQKFLEELAMMEISSEFIHFKRIDFFHTVMRSEFDPPGLSTEDISQFRKGLEDLELLLMRAKDDISKYNGNGRSSYSKNLGFKPKGK
jgi:hypothetical protein